MHTGSNDVLSTFKNEIQMVKTSVWRGGLLTAVCPFSSPLRPAECDIPVFEKSGKGGTYPRRYHVPFGFQDYSDGEVAPHVAVTFSRPAPVDSSSSSSPRRPQDLPSRPPDPGPRLPLPGQLQPHGAVPQHQQRQQHLHPRTGGAGSQAQGQRHRAHPHAHPLRHGHQSPQPL